MLSLILLWLSNICKADYIDLGVTKKPQIEALFNLGLGFEYRSLLTTLAINSETDNIISADLQANYYDKGVSYFVGIKQRVNKEKDINYKIGVGYPVNSKLSLVTHYSKQGLFFGVRRWF